VALLGRISTENVLLDHGLPPDPELDCNTRLMSLHALMLPAEAKVIPGVMGVDGALMEVL